MPMRRATLYRLVLPDHVCPYGVRALQLLEQGGYEVDEQILATRIEAEAFMAREGVAATPQVFIDGERIGGCEELELYLAGADAAA